MFFGRRLMKIAVIASILLVVFSSFLAAYGDPGSAHVGITSNDYSAHPAAISGINSTPIVPLPLPPNSINNNLTYNYSGPVALMITFKLQNQSALFAFLSQLSDRSSTNYHDYISRSQFASLYSVSQSFYQEVANYFMSFHGVKLQEYPDRVSLSITAPASVIDEIFHTSIKAQQEGGKIYYASTHPELPSFIGGEIASVAGFTNAPINVSYNLGSHIVGKGSTPFSGNYSFQIGNEANNALNPSSPYPQPFIYNGTQYIFGSDLQIAYQEQTLLNVSYPTNEVIATILWSGNVSGGQNIGPYYPRDVYAYFNNTLPSYEPHPHIYGVPINGAPQPGISSTYDTTGASNENTLDLEMVGGTAPGSSIYNVYGPTPSLANLDQALAYILNPNSTFPGLNNVSVISNSWGSPDYNDTTWYTYLQEAEARGITVLASSGDSGDNANSSKYLGTNYPGDFTEFPSSMAYNSFGVTAVGGTTLTLSSSLGIANQVAWYIASSSYSGPKGSTGGISQVFMEPEWQKTTEANNVILGAGRGVPDIAAIANNTVIYETVNGTSYYYFQNGYFYYEWGTSVACPIVAGLVAEINSIMAHYGLKNIGYLNPLLYELGNMQVEAFNSTSTTGRDITGTYNSTLPMLPYYDITFGQNNLNAAIYGYDLVTGWGSLYAYNFTAYLLNLNFTGYNGAALGVQNILNLSGLSVTSYYNSNNTTNEQFNASIQQNFFLANELGAPIYWIQNVIYITYYLPGDFYMTYSGWSIYPFYGLYGNSSVYEYNFPTGQYVNLPESFDIKSWLQPSPSASFNGQVLYYQVNGQTLSLPVPGAAYIIDALNYSYQWNGESFQNGPYPSEYNASWGLIPQIGLVGGPSLSTGYFESPTGGSLRSYIEPYGSGSYSAASSTIFGLWGDQTGELASNLQWTYSNGLWLLSINNGSSEQGVAFYQSSAQAKEYYNVTFTETGLPSGTAWSVTLNGSTLSSTSSITFTELNGTYSYTIGPVSGYESSPSLGAVLVTGYPISVSVAFSKEIAKNYTVTFTETGLPSGALWNVTLNGTSRNSSSSSIQFSRPNGTYYFSVGIYQGYSSVPYETNVTVSGSNVLQAITFTQLTYPVTFTESGLSVGTLWSISIDGKVRSSSTDSIVVLEPNGSYLYNVDEIKGYSASPASGAVTVNGVPQNVSITFLPIIARNYTVTFTEAGLPSGTTWYVTLSGVTGSSTSNSILFNATNGSYPFYVTSLENYTTSPSSGTIVVNGTAVSQTIVFTSTVIYFTGTINPSNASLYVNGNLVETQNGRFNVSLVRGETYSIEVTSPGYSNYYSNFTVTSSTSHIMSYTINLKVPVINELNSLIAFFVTIAAIVLMGIAAFILRRKKRAGN